MKPLSVYVIGGGRVGAALATLVYEAADAQLIGMWSRSAPQIEGTRSQGDLRRDYKAVPDAAFAADLLVLAITDQAIPAMAAELAPRCPGNLVVLHTCGAYAARDALAPLSGCCPIGTFHPCAAINEGPEGVEALRVAPIGVEGDAEAVRSATVLAKVLGLKSVVVSSAAMGLYHAAAVLASNHTTALLHHARKVFLAAGIDSAEADLLIASLCSSVARNVRAHGVPEALTGPVRRGDETTVARHLETLSHSAPEMLSVYARGTLLATESAAECETGAADTELEKIRHLVIDFIKENRF